MSTGQVHQERRAAQRFDFHLPVSIRLTGSEREGYGFSQDLSARGAFLYTDFPLAEGDAVELTLVMPSEITLADNMRVRCRGRVVRIARSEAGTKFGVAVHLEGYEFLPEVASEAKGAFDRISGLHERPKEAESEALDAIHARGASVP
jgi:hypothetical protein